MLGNCKSGGQWDNPSLVSSSLSRQKEGDRMGVSRPRHSDPGEGAKYLDLEKSSWVYGCPPGSREGWRSPGLSHCLCLDSTHGRRLNLTTV